MSRDCPQIRIQVQGKSTGRVYTLDARKAKGNDLIADKCHLNKHYFFVLFDCGALHSFAST